MSITIRISKDIYQKLEALARGFETPGDVIEKLLDGHVEFKTEPKENTNITPLVPATRLDLVFRPSPQSNFVQMLLREKKAYIRRYYTNDSHDTSEWNASKFRPESDLLNNLRSGYLRGWRQSGICKAVLAFNQDDLDI